MVRFLGVVELGIDTCGKKRRRDERHSHLVNIGVVVSDRY